MRDVLFGTDAANLFLDQEENLKKYNGKTFNVGGGAENGFNTSLLELIDVIDNNFPGKNINYSFAPWRDGDQKIYISNLRRIKQESRWKPETKILEGLKMMWQLYD